MTDDNPTPRSLPHDEIEALRLERFKVDMISAGVLEIVKPPIESLTVCPYCDQMRSDIVTRRLNTLYQNDESNWMTSCLDCYRETVEYYRERWSEIDS